MLIYKTEHALFSEFYEQQGGLRQVVAIRNSLLEQVNAAQHLPLDDKTNILPVALNLYVTFYEKNPNLNNRLNILAKEIGSFTTKEFQKASEFLGTVDPAWELPVFVVTWPKKKSDINQVIGNPICSKCKKELKRIGNLFDRFGHVFASHTDGTFSAGVGDPSVSGYDQWRGTICPNCDSIFCPNCLNSGGKDPCPVCQNRVIPALAKDIPFKQNFMGVTNTPILNQSNDDKVVFVREFKKQIELAPAGKVNTYMVYRADSAQVAQDFLAKHPENEDNIIIETPEGNFGKNKDGIYKEQ